MAPLPGTALYRPRLFKSATTAASWPVASTTTFDSSAIGSTCTASCPAFSTGDQFATTPSSTLSRRRIRSITFVRFKTFAPASYAAAINFAVAWGGSTMNMPSHSLMRLEGMCNSSRIVSAGAQIVALFIKYPPDQNPPPRKRACSIRSVLKPAAAKSCAQSSPDGPPPTMMTSLSMSRSNSWKYSRAICRVMSRSLRGAVHLFAITASMSAEGCLLIDFQPCLLELFGFLLHADLNGRLFIERFFFGILSHILGDLHRADMRAAHRAEVRCLRRVLGKRLIVEVFGRLGV